MRASRIVDQIETLRVRYPEAPLIVFVPRTQIGRPIETALARRQRGWGDFQTLIPRHYAEEVARLDLFLSERREAPVSGKLFRAARIAQAIPEEKRTGTLPGWHMLADTVAQAIDTLREGDVRVSAVKERAQEAGASDTLSIIASCYESYARELRQEKLYDDATVYQWATKRVQSEERVPSEVTEAVYAVVSAADLSEHAHLFLQALRQRGQAFFRLGVEDRSTPPPETAADRFPEAPRPGGSSEEFLETEEESSTEEASNSGVPNRFVRAVGARGEVRALLRDLLETESPFGETTIAYADSRPYATLLADEAERMGIPITMGTGLPAEQTRTGRALRDLYEWVREDYDPAILIRMLRGGLLRTDRWLRHRYDEGERDDQESAGGEGGGSTEGGHSTDESSLGGASEEGLPAVGEFPSFQPHEAATLLAERSYEPGRDGLLNGLEAAIRELGNGSEEADLTGREETRRARLKLLRAYVKDLTDVIPRQEGGEDPGTGDVQKMAARSCDFLERYGPTDAPDKPEAERTPDEAARGLLYQRLDRLSEMNVSCEASAPRLAALFQQWLSGQYVQAESPRPGHAHVLPLESAGYSDRSELHVVGLDSTTFAAPGADSGMLQETDRRALVSSLDELGAEAGRSTPADDALWRAERSLRRHRGRTCLYAKIYEVEAGEERDPSSLFLQAEQIGAQPEVQDGEASAPVPAEREAEEGDVEGLVPGPESLALSDGELWLQSYRRGRSRSEGDSKDSADALARQRLGETYPWILAGESARQAKRSGEYTIHDGLLPAGRYPELNLFDSEERPLSASRLETLAETPYVYFLKYILGVRPLDEPALDEEPWLNRLRKGSLLHEIYERFMRKLRRAPDPEDASLMRTVVKDVLEEEAEEFAPPSPVVKNAAERELLQDAMLFLRSEIERGEDYVPENFEWGFGLPPRRQEEQDEEEAARLSVGEETFLLRGRADRVDRHRETGGLAVWDYKTGSTSSYDEDDPLQDGKTLQWALYAYALEALREELVRESGYYFATVKEVGRRISADPGRYRADVDRLLRRLAELASTGSFPVTPGLEDANDWEWGGYDRLFSDLEERGDELGDKEYPEGRSKPPSFG